MMRSKQSGLWVAAALAIAFGLLSVPATAGPSALAAASVSPHGIDWQPSVQYEKIVLTVTGPSGLVVRREFAAGASLSFDAIGADGSPLADGSYTYELVAAPVLDRATKRMLANARRNGDDAVVEKLRAAGKLPSSPMIQSGSFMVSGGVILQQDDREEQTGGNAQTKAAPKPVTAADQVIPDDLIVQGSECVGLDCVNNENFGFDTIRLKENNLRIHFDDTSTSAGFPANDWRLIANDSASGGSSKFSIEDSTSAKTPFTVTAGAATNSIFVDSTGRVGFRTSTPVLDLHVATSNTPAVRLEQNNSGGFTAQTWDIGANEANFFIRDVTGGSKLSLRIRPGAPTSSLDISADGDVGVGTASPDSKLHVSGSDGATKLHVSETNGTATLRNMMTLTNNGGVQFLLERTDGTANEWQISNFNSTFEISVPGSSPGQFSLNSNGNLTIGGTNYFTGSSRDLKENFVPVDSVKILQRLVQMPLTEWSAKNDPTQRHLSPVAEDWWATFRLGPDDKHVSPTDIAGVALAAIKGLNQVVSEKDSAIAQLKTTVDELQKQNDAMAARLAAIEQALKAQQQ
ncbi:MAG TPA: hypothetical protein VGX68_22870 [Thermoanaerobaculia bacterium]|jgi:hypothetical protein|nr:hypothetical protein [Thermoanaerobaculia bacterium]